MIKKIIFGLCLIVMPMLASAQFNQPTDAADCTNIFFRALLEEDSKTLDNLLSSDFSVTSFDGQLIDRNTLLGGVSEGYLKVDTGMMSGMRTRSYGDVGVVTGIWNARGQLQGNSFNNELAYMAVCVKAGGSWKISAVQFTPLR
ncbi:nuclear transport factor 2 family protein [Dyadobacter sp. CY312]|uniref:nuclear transport factor 2 family protein n=1 Tax=Dyadobacter sp. CY312 TaxID=2907303 RepID=UPI001F339FB8|nr:nuclear transport factor 2 family protein [Dyadobacter sp. CY312]MCE7043115.1 nuclear transport factor 2 family protein [Dyadobacter sp. CY312]